MSAATVLVFAVAAALSSDGTLTGKVQDEVACSPKTDPAVMKVESQFWLEDFH